MSPLLHGPCIDKKSRRVVISYGKILNGKIYDSIKNGKTNNKL